MATSGPTGYSLHETILPPAPPSGYDQQLHDQQHQRRLPQQQHYPVDHESINTVRSVPSLVSLGTRTSSGASSSIPADFHLPSVHLGSFNPKHSAQRYQHQLHPPSSPSQRPSTSYVPASAPQTPVVAAVSGANTSLRGFSHKHTVSLDRTSLPVPDIPPQPLSVSTESPPTQRMHLVQSGGDTALVTAYDSADPSAPTPKSAGQSQGSGSDNLSSPQSVAPHLTLTIPLDPSVPAVESKTSNPHGPLSTPATSTGVVSAPSQVPSLSPAASPTQRSTVPTLGSLPILSPITPLSTTAFTAQVGDYDDDDPTANDSQRPLSWAVPPPAPGSQDGSVRRDSTERNATRVLSTLHIQVPVHLSPKKAASFDLDSPRLRESPSVAQRRTIVEPSDVSWLTSPVEVTQSSTTHEHPQLQPPRTPPARSTQTTHSEAFGYDAPSSPSPRRHLDPATSAVLAPARSSLSSCRDIDSLREGHVVTASQKQRSLAPHPPLPTNEPSHMAAVVETIPMPVPMPTSPQTVIRQHPLHHSPPNSRSARIVSGPSKESANTRFPVPIPAAATPSHAAPPSTPSRARPPSPERSRSFAATPTKRAEHLQPTKSSSMPTQVPAMPFNPRHQPTNSASNLPAIPGLSEPGPYPSAAPPTNGPSGNLAIPGANGGGGAGRNIPPIPRQEEVCLECMMRDRDLADVIVQGEGIWDRESDAGWSDLKEREQDLMRSWSIDHAGSSLCGTSLEEDSSESPSSPRSHTSALPPDDPQRNNNALRKQVRDARRAQREEQDAQIARVGWRGFKWEEGSGGDGFPRGFRGTRPGALTEKGIKNVMTMFPSSSALRYQILQNYLRGQYRLIIEIRQEAERLGHFPEPEEPSCPDSPTISSHESAPIASGSKPRRVTPRSMDFTAPSIKAPSVSTARSAPVAPMPQSGPTLRQSPSTPAGLGSQVTHRLRPKTYYSDREPPQPLRENLNPASASATRTSHYKVPSGSTMPKGRESRFYAGDDWSDGEDLWPPASPGSGNLRPFSFAVRAGAAASQGSDTGHNRRSFFGRFGGSVTSLFTGSHGGSGSMMDMHLGLESDRRDRSSSYQVHDTRLGLSPSTSRPTFNSRQSASSVYLTGQDDRSVHHQHQRPPSTTRERERPRSRSVSGSRLTQVSLFDDVDEPPNKKKGLKGLLQKMKPRNKRQASQSSLVGITVGTRPEEDVSTSELAPPPPMAFLVNRGDREHNRQGSGSSQSQSNDDGSMVSLSPQTAMGPGVPTGNRSVSGPGATASSASGSVSPTSSRFQPDRQDSTPRRRTDPALELPPGAAEPSTYVAGGSAAVMEMLTGSSQASVPNTLQPSTPVYDEPQSFATRESMMAPNGHPPAYRKQSSLSSRYSTSTTTVPAIETPEPAASATYLLPHQVSSPPGTLSPNRHKNLPPLPPGGYPPVEDMDASYSSRGSMYEQQKRTSTNPAGTALPRVSMAMSDTPTIHRTAVAPSADYFPTASPRFNHVPPMPSGPGSPTYLPHPPVPGRTLQPRASFDVLSDRRNRRGSAATSTMLMPSENMVNYHPQSMYMQHTAAASTGSFGRFLKGNEVASPPAMNTVMNSVPQTADKKERRRGIKSIFSKKG